MKITAITQQVRDKNRVNVSVDGLYRFSLDVVQLIDLKIKIGNDYSEDQLISLEEESQFGKLYARALDYCLRRPHSQKELKDYLYKKTRDTRTKTGSIKKGVSVHLTERVFQQLEQKGYSDDEAFTQFWVENRNVRKGSSQRKLAAELSAKGIDRAIIEKYLDQSDRTDSDELLKIIRKKQARYDDDQKFMSYLARQGFSYDDIKSALQNNGDEN